MVSFAPRYSPVIAACAAGPGLDRRGRRLDRRCEQRTDDGNARRGRPHSHRAARRGRRGSRRAGEVVGHDTKPWMFDVSDGMAREVSTCGQELRGRVRSAPRRTAVRVADTSAACRGTGRQRTVGSSGRIRAAVSSATRRISGRGDAQALRRGHHDRRRNRAARYGARRRG